MTKRALDKLLLTGVSVLFMGQGGTALAYEAEEETYQLEEIVVTAQRRTESLQDVSVAATALSSDGLKDKGVERLSDLQFASPSLSISDSGLTQSVNIRGIGLASSSPNVANGVATYVDGVFQPPIISSGSFYDIASVEVLRGPQGTFVGSNSTGGAIFINSRNPDLDGVSGYAQASVGNYNAYGFEGAVNLPVNSTLAVRAALNYKQRDSFYNDLGYGNEAGSLDEIAGRFGVLWQPNESFQALWKTEFSDKKTGGYAYRPITGTLYSAARTGDIRNLTYDSPTLNNEKAVQSSLELRYETSGGVTLRSLSAYQNKRINNLYDSDGSMLIGLAQSTQDQYVRERVWTEEVNIISPTDEAISWIVGGYFQRNKIDVDITNHSGGFPTDVVIANKKTTTGIFGQFTYDINEEVKIDVGIRYSHYKVTGEGSVKIGNGIPSFPVGGLQVADIGGSHSDSGVTGKIAVNWTPDDDNLFYAFVARGYKSGGYASQTFEFEPETVIDYEFGWKTSFADDRIRTQLGAFYYDYKNFQIDVLNTSTGRSGPDNLTNASVKGFEGQVQGQFDGFGFDLGFAFVDSSLSSATFVNQRAFNRAYPGVNTAPQCPDGTATNLPTCVDYAPFIVQTDGGPNLFSPKWTLNVGVEYAIEFENLTITPRVNYAYVGSQYSYIGYSDISDKFSAHGLLSFRTVFDFQTFTAEIYGTNMTNNEYISGQSGDNEFYGSPRQIGARFRMDF